MKNMRFDVSCVRKYLMDNGEVYSVRGYKYWVCDQEIWVDGVGICSRVRVGEVVRKEDLERFMGKSGFENVEDWWKKIVGFCGNREKWLYYVKVRKRVRN